MEGIVVAATVAIAFSSVISLVVTWRLSQDNRVLRKVGTEPEVVAYLAPDSRHGLLVNLILENVGQGPARDVELFVNADPKDFASHEVMDVTPGVTRKVRSLLPQGERAEQLLGLAYKLFGEDEANGLQPFCVSISYSDLRGSNVESKDYTLDISELEGTAVVTSTDNRIADSLQKMENHVRQISRHLGHFRKGGLNR